MDDRIRKRVLAFYFAGFLNLILGLYVLLYGRNLVEQGTWYLLLAFFFGFAAVDFWFARNLRKNWTQARARLAAGQAKDEGNPVIRKS